MASAHVVPSGTQWQVKDGVVISTHNLQADAINAARSYIAARGGGELFIHGENGAVRAKDTVAPGNDPRGRG
ncbi:MULTISPECIES: DUF2188 domain-containing protein [unclassified Leifsonia]|uniref:DUF2188 domain-containing protein n=1 Tax=unclassified Leifsonia TaxID=2663824 RepID=UPI0009E7E505